MGTAAVSNSPRLEPFDVLLWVCNGQLAAQITSLSQPTICRAAHQLSKSLGLSLRKIRGEWHVAGQTTRLDHERRCHQQDRLAARADLRLEAGAISSRLLADPPPEGWVLGRADAINQPRSLLLLQKRIIDAWICTSADDLPEEPEPAVVVLEIHRTPLRLVASDEHPLTGERGLRPDDLTPFPSVALDGDWYPTSAARLQAHGLWRDPRRLTHYKRQHWEGRTADGLTLAYASPLTLARNPTLNPLDFDLGVDHALALVVSSDLADHPRIQRLHQELRQRAALLLRGEACTLRAA